MQSGQRRRSSSPPHDSSLPLIDQDELLNAQSSDETPDLTSAYNDILSREGEEDYLLPVSANGFSYYRFFILGPLFLWPSYYRKYELTDEPTLDTKLDVWEVIGFVALLVVGGVALSLGFTKPFLPVVSTELLVQFLVAFVMISAISIGYCLNLRSSWASMASLLGMIDADVRRMNEKYRLNQGNPVRTARIITNIIYFGLLLCAVAAIAVATYFNVRHVGELDPTFWKTKFGLAIAGRIIFFFGALTVLTIAALVLAHFASMAITLRLIMNFLGDYLNRSRGAQIKANSPSPYTTSSSRPSPRKKDPLDAQVQRLVRFHGAAALAVHSQADAYRIPLVITFILEFAGFMYQLFRFLSTKQWPYAVGSITLVIPAFILIALLALIASGSNGIFNKTFLTLARYKTSAKRDYTHSVYSMADRSHLLTYLSVTPIYWNIFIDVTPTFLITLLSIVITLFTVVSGIVSAAKP